MPCHADGAERPVGAPGARRGFTLLEVMAALAVFAVLYVVIFRAATGGIFLEAEARRRIDASLLADREILELEGQALIGSPPPLGRTERVEEDLLTRVIVEVTPLDPASLGIELAPNESPEGNDLRRRSARGAPGTTSLFDVAAGDTTPLVQVRVTVAWIEPRGPREVSRSGWLYSPEAAAPLLQGLTPEPAGFDPEEDGAEELLDADDVLPEEPRT